MFEVLRAVARKNAVFWVVMSRSLGIYHLTFRVEEYDK
jgi:hypothetical protein